VARAETCSWVESLPGGVWGLKEAELDYVPETWHARATITSGAGGATV
jgi:hypothetical protein